jgi:hypothetical protein
METKFRITYEDNHLDIISTISDSLRQFGLEIVDREYGDGWEDFEIVKIDNENKK